MTDLAYRLERTLVIRATPATVFGFFTETPRWASWWGPGSTIDPRPGGRMLIRHPNGIESSGEVIEVQPPSRIVFTYGYATGPPSPPGSSRVTIRIGQHADGTLLTLVHEFPNQEGRDEHVQGWRFQLSLFSNLLANLLKDEAEARIDRWFEMWSEADALVRDKALRSLVADSVVFRDRFSCIQGFDELQAQLAAVHRFMPGMRLTRNGPVRYCQWNALADWIATGADGQERGRGTNAFTLDADGRITAATGFWSAQP